MAVSRGGASFGGVAAPGSSRGFLRFGAEPRTVRTCLGVSVSAAALLTDAGASVVTPSPPRPPVPEPAPRPRPRPRRPGSPPPRRPSGLSAPAALPPCLISQKPTAQSLVSTLEAAFWVVFCFFQDLSSQVKLASCSLSLKVVRVWSSRNSDLRVLLFSQVGSFVVFSCFEHRHCKQC